MGMPESQSSSSGTLDYSALAIAPCLLECVGDLQRVGVMLSQRNAELEAEYRVPWGSHQELLLASIAVVRHEADRLECAVREAPTVVSLAEKRKAAQP